MVRRVTDRVEAILELTEDGRKIVGHGRSRVNLFSGRSEVL